MKFSKKMAAVLATTALLASVFTGCGGLGKDDFYGTWTTSYTIPTAADTDSQGGGYNSSYAGDTVDLEMFFSGTTTSSAFSTCVFYQHKQRTDVDTNTVSHTFWVGTYNLSNNSELTSGDLELSYMYGYGWTGNSLNASYSYTGSSGDIESGTITSVDDFVTSAKAANWDFFEGISGVQSQVLTYNNKNYCSDIETFTFGLGDQSLFEGYKSMSATEKCWEGYFVIDSESEPTTKTSGSGVSYGTASSKPKKYTLDSDSCSWEVKTRSFTLSSDDGSSASSISDFFTDDDTSSSTSSNVITFSRVLDDIYIK